MSKPFWARFSKKSEALVADDFFKRTMANVPRLRQYSPKLFQIGTICVCTQPCPEVIQKNLDTLCKIVLYYLSTSTTLQN